MSKACDVVAIATAEIGYREKATNSNLDDKTANSGGNNWTKYAHDLANAGYYNGDKNGYAWCDIFVDWCFFKAFGKDEAQRVQCQTGPLGAACVYSAQYYKQQGRYDRIPRIGDQIFFYSNGDINHTGIVVDVKENKITTVEGNSADMVQKNMYFLSNSYIDGFGHPIYDEINVPVDDGTDVHDTSINAVTVELNELSEGTVGAQVKTIQRILRMCGIDNSLKIDGEFGPMTKRAVVKMQEILFKELPSEWDGIVGEKTWTAMLKNTE